VRRTGAYNCGSNNVIASPAEYATTKGLCGRQRTIFEAFTGHAEQTLHNLQNGTLQHGAPPPENWVLVGEGGSGKTFVIQQIIDYFTARGWHRHLRVSATTGAAASNLERLASTIDSLAGLKRGCENTESQTALRKSMDLNDVYYVIIDEFSMLSCEKLAKVLASLSHGQPSNNATGAGRISILFSGDPFQFAPVDGHSLSNARHVLQPRTYLGNEVAPNTTQINAKIGATFWMSIKNVIVLETNHRQNACDVLKGILTSMRTGQLSSTQVETLNTRLLTKNPFRNAAELAATQFIVQRNAVRIAINASLVPIAAATIHVQAVRVISKDVLKYDSGEYNTSVQRWIDTRASERSCGDLPREAIYYIGQKIRFLHNTAPQFGIANGSVGIICEIIMDASDEVTQATNGHILTAFPRQILVKVPLLGNHVLDGDYGPGIIPITSATAACSVTVHVLGQQVKIDFKRTAFPIIPTLCVTDYKSQGHTYENAVVDLTYPPKGRKDYILAVYVMLSRVKTLHGLRILADFDAQELQQPFPEYVSSEWLRLNSLCAAFMKKFHTLHQEQPNFQASSANRTAIVRSPQLRTVSPKPPPLHNVIDLSSDIAPASYNIFSNAKARFLTLQTVREHSIVVPPDGNCFYSALAVTLCKHYSDSSWNARRVRDTMVTYLTSEAGEIAFKHRWKPAWYEGNTGRSSTYDDFVSSVRTSTIWAVYTVLLVARRVFDRVNIRVFRPALTAGSCSSTSPSSPGTSATRLYLTLDPLKQGVNDANLVFEGDNHYNALMHMRTKELDGTQAAAIQ
jgi:hypothetical protein